jgi:hypothetical protein
MVAAAHQVLRLTPDHWMIPLFGIRWPTASSGIVIAERPRYSVRRRGRVCGRGCRE